MTILVSREVPETNDLQKGYNGAFGMDLSLLQQLTENRTQVYLRDMFICAICWRYCLYQKINMQLLKKVNALYKTLQFTLQTKIDTNMELVFLNMSKRVSNFKKSYRKPADKPPQF